ncbi:hypothetical protein RI129_012815 [Pyrocoelia pectoralis]|uniref:Uncharacterized protein n=1 Tax=Pyrocoelia pectoralis TaxID=417401 RepID=A0AAN7UUH1_9COLE
MKLILLISIFVVAIASKKIPDNIRDDFEKIIEKVKPKCIEETKVELPRLEKMLKELDFSDDQPLKCYWRCLHTKANIYKTDGSYDTEVIVKKFKFITKDLAEKCAEMTKAEMNKCDESFKYTLCIIGDLVV